MELSDAPDLSRFKLVEVFTSCTDDDVKGQIVSSVKLYPRSHQNHSKDSLCCGSFWDGFRLYRYLPGASWRGILHPRNRERRL